MTAGAIFGYNVGMTARTAFLLPAALLLSAWAGAASFGPADLAAPVAAAAIPAPSPPSRTDGQAAPLTTAEKITKAGARAAALQVSLVNLPGDLGRLEQDIFRARELGPEFVRDSARGLSADLRRYAAEARSLAAELQKLRTAGEKSAELDAAAAGLYAKARLLSEASRYHVQPAVEKTLWALRSAGAKDLGEATVWEIVELSRQAGELNWSARDISEYSGNLWLQVYPGPAQPGGPGVK